MKLQTKALAITVLFGCGLGCALFAVAALVLWKGFANVEREDLRRRARTAQAAFDRELAGTTRLAADWATRDGMARFVEGAHDGVALANCDEKALAAVGIDLLMVFRPDGTLRFGTTLDPETGEAAPVPEDLLARAWTEDFQACLHSPDESAAGVLLAERGPLAIAVHPIATAPRGESVRGLVVLGRTLDERRVAGLADEAQVVLRIYRLDDAYLSGRLRRVADLQEVREEPSVAIDSDRQAQGYFLVRDPRGHPVLLGEVVADRAIAAQGRSSLILLLACLAVVVVGTVVLVRWLIQRLVLARLLSLARQVERIAADPGRADEVAVGGRDELTMLAESVNAMQSFLVQSNEELLAAKQAAEQANAAKSQFLATVSHEIRTPLSAILGYTDFLLAEHERPDDPARETLSTIQRNGEHLMCLVNDMLDLSKIEADKLELHARPCAPAEIVADVIELTHAAADAKGLSLVANYDGALPEDFAADPIRLKQILANLVGNAVKFTERGGVDINLGTADGPSGRELCIAVHDTGIGISPDDLARVFEPFTQVNAASRRAGGTGLGLAISRRMAEAMGGRIEASSTPGEGSRFTLALPVQPPETATPPRSAVVPSVPMPMPTASARPLADCRILLAEDGPDNQRLIAAILRKAGAEVAAVDHGRAALEKVVAAQRDGKPMDLVLLDVQMPVMDGCEAARQLRARGYRAPIVALTAHAMAQDREECLAAGCDSYLTKPIDRHALVKHLANAIFTSRQQWVAGQATPAESGGVRA